MRSMIASNSGSSVVPMWRWSPLAVPRIAFVYRVGNSACSSVAPRSRKRSNVSFRTWFGRAWGRSILLTTRMARWPRRSAWRSTNLVCGIGPSTASTSSSTPSTMFMIRSTSPPKSAWPGVSTMLIFTPRYITAVFFAMIVMPRSRSRAFESITRSAICWFSRKMWLCRSIPSTSVVLPWSTWAMIATLRMSVRFTWVIVGHGDAARVSVSTRNPVKPAAEWALRDVDDEREGAGHGAGRGVQGHEHPRAVDRVAFVLRDAREEELRRVGLAVDGDFEVDVLGAAGIQPRDHGLEAIRAVRVGKLPPAEGVAGVVIVAVAVGLPEVELRARERLARCRDDISRQGQRRSRD